MDASAHIRATLARCGAEAAAELCAVYVKTTPNNAARSKLERLGIELGFDRLEARRLETLELECRARFIAIAKQQEPTDVPLDLYVDGFWEGVAAQKSPRSAAVLRDLLGNPDAVIEGFSR